MQQTVTLPDNIQFESVQKCDLCGTGSFALWDLSRGNSLFRCTNCGLVFTSPRIKDSAVKDNLLYSQIYFGRKSRMTDKLVNARKRTYKIEIDFLKKYINSGSILDVGCGTGVFLEAFGDAWEKYGCDVSSYAVKEANLKNIRAYHGEFEKLDFNNNEFDVVYFRASLHHTYSPNECLKKANKLLKKGGIIVISMSNNYDGLAGRIFKGHVKSYEQAHNYLFSTKTLRAYLSQNYFDVLKVGYPYWGTGYESYSDFLKIIPGSIKYMYLSCFHSINKKEYCDFSSPAFYANYINIYGRKKG